MKSIKTFLGIATFWYWLLCCACVSESKPVVENQKKAIQQNENKNQQNIPSPKESSQQKLNAQKEGKLNSQEAISKKNKTNEKKPIEKQTGKTSTKKATSKTPLSTPQTSSKSIVSNNNKSEKERLATLQSFDNRISDKAEYALLKKLVQSENESFKIRQEALKKIYSLSGQDEDMLDYLFGVVSGKKDRFKKDALYALQTIKYSSNLFQKKQPAFLNALKSGLYNTKDKKMYHLLLKTLAEANDPLAHETAIDLLKQEDFSQVSSTQLLQLLKKNIREQHYTSLQRIVQNTENIEIKTQLIPLLIDHPGSKAKFIQYLGKKSENIKTRLACADALMKHDEPSFYIYTKNIIWDKEDDIEIRRQCLSLINEADKKTLAKYASLKDDMLNMGISDNTLNQLREALLKKLP